MLVLLDLDGTLTDPYDGITRSVAHAVARLGLPPLTERQLRSFIGPPLPDQFAAPGLRGSEVERAVVLGVTWGYAEPGELEAAHADVVVATPAALVDALVLERGRAGTPAPVRASGPAAP